MNVEAMIKDIEELVENQCRQESNIFGYEIWEYHIKQVVEYAVILADSLVADKEVVKIAALLHDYAGIKDKAMYEQHHIYGAEEAEKILLSYGYELDKIKEVKTCIIEHRGSVLLEKTSKESICIASADAMAHIASVPSLLHLAYVKKGMKVDEGAAWVKGKIERSYKKLCKEAREVIQHKYEAVKEILY
ncbi:HD domain-containing protein [Clostridium sp. 19966]|uniref:HD domain-containing protein n=1 Tax=Clostridium sp. 19966 TaxID=2768166 RepID=UPI0028DEA94A|nr:HD domain-containing protein [Clostridium sp. 19966]MDT8717926.1 HD domain-containing protein [Clostridium sp. 19966]